MNRYPVQLALVAGLVVFASRAVAGDDAPLPYFVGKAVCGTCHSDDTSGAHVARPCSLGLIPAHAHATKLLTRETAASIAALSGVGKQPRESRICLDCHATAADEGPRWTRETFHQADGVQCEACHGPGSLHATYHQSPHASLDVVPRDARMFAGSREECVRCHIDRPSHHEVLANGFRLALADARYKTPVNLVVSPDGTRLYVACEQSDSVVVVDAERGAVVGEIAVGRAPHGVAVDATGRRLYVSNRLSGTVTAIDTRSGEVIGETAVGSEPHGLWVDPSGEHLFVANTGNNSLSIVDTRKLTETRRLVMGEGPWDVASDSAGRRLYVTNVRPQPAPFREPHHSELSVVEVASSSVVNRRTVADANMVQGVAWVPGADVGLVTLMRTKNLVPITRLRQGWVITSGLGVIERDGAVVQVLLDEPNRYFPDPMDVAVSPDGKYALVTSGASDEVALVDVAKLLAFVRAASLDERENVLPNYLRSSRQFVARRIRVGANPRGVAFAPDGSRAYVVNALDDSVSVIDAADFGVTRTISLGGPEEVTEIRRGERLFHSAAITYAQQFSCHSCHPDGHINGLSFDIEADGIGMHPVDNRTLRGIFDTPPFKWEGTNPSLYRQCGPRLAVFFTRLDPYSDDELRSLVRYMCTIERAPNPHRAREGLTPAQRRGEMIFRRRELVDGTPIPPKDRCATCHRGALLTDRKTESVGTTMWLDRNAGVDPNDWSDTENYGTLGIYTFVAFSRPRQAFDVPHLRNIFNSPPYLHNGGAPTLEEIWTRFNVIELHGMTGNLTRPQYNDLIAYLKSL